MNPLTLNAIALSIFTMTLGVLIGPAIHLSPSWVALTTLVVLSAATFDAFQFESRGLTLLLDAIAQLSPRYRQRILHHEAGHFIAAYVLQLPIQDYTLSVWEAYRAGHAQAVGVQVAFPLDSTSLSPAVLKSLATVWMAGGVAETLVYGTAAGDASDRQQLAQILAQLGLHKTTHEAQAQQQARQLLQQHWSCYQAILPLLAQRTPVAECYAALKQMTSTVEFARSDSSKAIACISPSGD